MTKKIYLRDAQEALVLFGPQDQNLRFIEKTYGVQVFARGNILSIRGPAAKVEKAAAAIEEMRDNTGASAAEALGERRQESGPGQEAAYTSALGKSIRPRTEMQKDYVDAIAASDMVVAIGPAGTGKTYLAVACALAALKSGSIHRIILTRPVVEAGEKLGYLPGDFYEKVNPYLRPLYDAFYAMLGPDKFRLYRDEETIEIAPLAYMRGRTLENAFVILDEAQNTTPEQMKMILTRLGNGSKMVINGDVSQIDLENKKRSGLVQLPLILKGISGLRFIYFSEADVVRHRLVKDIIRAYQDWEKRDD